TVFDVYDANSANLESSGSPGAQAILTVQPPPAPISVTFGYDSAIAYTTAGATTYWLALDGSARLDSVVKADSGGEARWNAAVRSGAIVAVIDSNGAATAGVGNFVLPAKNASGLLQRGPDGRLSRLEIDNFLPGTAASVLWARRGVGAWWMDSRSASVVDYQINAAAELFVADAKPIGSSPPPPAELAAGDVVVALIHPRPDYDYDSAMVLRVTPRMPVLVPRIVVDSVSLTVNEGSSVTYRVRRLHESGTTLTARYTVRGVGTPSN